MLLAIDTSTRQIGVALFEGSRILTESAWTSPFHHTVELAPAVEQALRRTGITFPDLSAIGVAIGPGSFTALRIGLAFAKGLALARQTPLVGIPSLAVTAAGAPPSELPLVAVLEAGRKRLAAARCTWTGSGWQIAGAAELVTLDVLAAGLTEPTILYGELNPEAIAPLAGHPFARPMPAERRPGLLAALAWKRFCDGEQDDPAALAPIYLSTTGIDA
jgi:tRNA threonylcarbamoyladenosine biosynthesis protein TsaB